MNASQLLEVATKVIVNQDQEARQEANRKMKRKVDILTASLAGQSDGPWQANPNRGRGKDRDKCLQDTPSLWRNQGEINVPTVIKKGTGKMNVPNRPGTPKRPPRLEAEAKLLKENISPPTTGKPVSGRIILSVWQAWKAIRTTRTDQAPFYWAPRSL
jgi:hypothetical protein